MVFFALQNGPWSHDAKQMANESAPNVKPITTAHKSPAPSHTSVPTTPSPAPRTILHAALHKMRQSPLVNAALAKADAIRGVIPAQSLGGGVGFVRSGVTRSMMPSEFTCSPEIATPSCSSITVTSCAPDVASF